MTEWVYRKGSGDLRRRIAYRVCLSLLLLSVPKVFGAIQGTWGATSSATVQITVTLEDSGEGAALNAELNTSQQTFLLACQALMGGEQTQGINTLSLEVCSQIDQFQSITTIDQSPTALTVTVTPI